VDTGERAETTDKPGQPTGDEALWRTADRLLERASIPGILAHKMGPLAAFRLRRLGRPLPKPLADEERAASLAMLTGMPLIDRIRSGSDGPLLLLKGPEVANVYPPKGRRFGDIDILTPTADEVQRSLLARGFVLCEPDFDMSHGLHHHRQPIRWPSVWLDVEVHSGLNWPKSMQPPRLEEILEGAVPSSTGIDGMSAPHPLHHALILAAHAWRHEPLQSLRDLLDIAALRVTLDARDLDALARRWGMARIWHATAGATDALFFGGRRTVPLRTWARHLGEVRTRSVFENHLQRWLRAFWELSPGAAVSQTATVLAHEIAPAEDETWSDKRRRVAKAIRNPRARVEAKINPDLPVSPPPGDDSSERPRGATSP